MAKTHGALFSPVAQGTLSHALTYQAHPSLNRVIKTPDHADANTPAQRTHRTLYLAACAFWGALHEHEQEFYSYLGAQVGVTGFNYCIASYLFGYIP